MAIGNILMLLMKPSAAQGGSAFSFPHPRHYQSWLAITTALSLLADGRSPSRSAETGQPNSTKKHGEHAPRNPLELVGCTTQTTLSNFDSKFQVVNWS
jgi:hypothetical protein